MNNQEQLYLEEIFKTYNNPLAFVRAAYPWKEQGTMLENRHIEKWQEEVLRKLGQEIIEKEKKDKNNYIIRIAVKSGQGVGKVQPNSLIVSTPHGQVEWGNIKVGDYLFGLNGKPTKVLATFPHKDWQFYKITFDDGSSTMCGLEHLWTVKGRSERRFKKDWITLSLGQLLEKGIYHKNGKIPARQWQLPINSAVEYSEKQFIIEPYLMGIWLGDGTKNRNIYYKPDEEVREHLKELGYNIKYEKKYYRNTILNQSKNFKDDIFKCYCYEKYIPEEYKFGSIEQRFELLRGILDTDGECSKNGIVVYSSTSEKLIDDVSYLARSLGAKVHKQSIKKGRYKKDNKIIECRDCYRITIRFKNLEKLFYIKRKQERVKVISQERYITRWIDSVEKVGIMDGQCVKVDADDSIYLTNDFIPTHNTSCLSWLIHWFMSTRINPQIIVTANTENQLKNVDWRELSKWNQLAFNKDWFEWTATSYYLKDYQESHRAVAIPYNESRPEAFQGIHANDVLIIFDEASGIPEIIWEVVEGTIKTGRCIFLAFSNPTQNRGSFRECFGNNSHRWTGITVDSREVSFTNKDEINEDIKLNGEDSDYVRIRIKGEFPRIGDNQFIGGDLVENCFDYEEKFYHDFPVVIGVDVARGGDDESVICIRQGRKVHGFLYYRGINDGRVLASYVVEQAKKWDTTTILVDGIGVGASPYDFLKMFGYDPIDVQSGRNADNPVKYKNKRDEMYGKLKDAMQRGLDIERNKDNIKLKEQLECITYHYTPELQLKLDKKEDLKKQGFSSPDRADALALTFAYDVYENVGNKVVERVSSNDLLKLRKR